MILQDAAQTGRRAAHATTTDFSLDSNVGFLLSDILQTKQNFNYRMCTEDVSVITVTVPAGGKRSSNENTVGYSVEINSQRLSHHPVGTEAGSSQRPITEDE